MLQLLPPCSKCGKRLNDLYGCVGGCGRNFCKKEGVKIKLEIGKGINGKMIYGFFCYECQKNNAECGTSGTIKNEMTCKKCQQYPILNDKDKICAKCEKELK